MNFDDDELLKNPNLVTEVVVNCDILGFFKGNDNGIVVILIILL